MWKISNKSVVLLVLATLRGQASAQEVTARLNFNPGEPRKGAFCTDEAKHLILDGITKHLVTMQSSKIDDGAYDEWCANICLPNHILFCELMAEQCRSMKGRRKLSEFSVHETSTVGREEDTSLVVFTDNAEHKEGHRHLRRALASGRVIEYLSEAEKSICNDIKGPLMRSISNELASELDDLCIRLLRQKLVLDCILFT